jgi:hypothetical protein
MSLNRNGIKPSHLSHLEEHLTLLARLQVFSQIGGSTSYLEDEPNSLMGRYKMHVSNIDF